MRNLPYLCAVASSFTTATHLDWPGTLGVAFVVWVFASVIVLVTEGPAQHVCRGRTRLSPRCDDCGKSLHSE